MNKLLSAAVTSSIYFLLAVSLSIPVVNAQNVLEEVTVTARKREESLQDVPLSITAISTAQIVELGIIDTRDVASFVPNVTMDNYAGRANNTYVFIRGVGGGNGNAASLQAGVGIYEDGVYMPRAQGGYLSTLDIERIEVLRGPQGTLFGKNTTGGAVNIISVKPGPELSSNWTFRVGNYERYDVKGSVNIPLIEETLFARITGASELRKGFYTEVNSGDDYGNRKRFSGRIAFRYLPNEHWTLDLSGSYSNQPERTPGATCVFNEFIFAHFVLANEGVNFQEACNASDRDKRTFSSDLAGFSHTQVWGVNSQTTWDSLGSVGPLDNLKIKLLAAWRGQEQSFLEDSDWSEARFLTRSRINPVLQEQYTLELQFNGAAMDDRLQLTAGVYWGDDVAEEDGNDCRDELAQFRATGEDVPCIGAGGFQFDVLPGVAPFGPFPLLLASQVTARIETKAVYANASFDLTEDLNLTLGGRYTSEHRDFVRFDIAGLDKSGSAVIAVINDTNVAKIVDGDETWKEFTPTTSLSYSLAPVGALDSGNLYFTYAKGFQSGGFNTEFDQPEYSGPSRPPIPVEAGHPFRLKAATDSGEAGHP